MTRWGLRASGVGGDLTIVINTGAIMTGPTGGVPSPPTPALYWRREGGSRKRKYIRLVFYFWRKLEVFWQLVTDNSQLISDFNSKYYLRELTLNESAFREGFRSESSKQVYPRRGKDPECFLQVDSVCTQLDWCCQSSLVLRGREVEEGGGRQHRCPDCATRPSDMLALLGLSPQLSKAAGPDN